MSAYMIFVRTEMKNDKQYLDYLQKGARLVEKYNGEILVLNGEHETLEGIDIDGAVVLRFPDMKSARSFYNSDEYKAVKPLRTSATKGLAFLIDDYTPA